MNELLEQLTSKLDRNTVLDDGQFTDVLSSINCKFPEDYLQFMKERNGGEGTILNGAYVRFWKFEELIEANTDYMVSEFAPTLF